MKEKIIIALVVAIMACTFASCKMSGNDNSTSSSGTTNTTIADKVYMEPLTLEYIAKIIRYERPDAIVPGIGGQTGLNLAMQLEKKGILKECCVELLGTSSESIERAEDRELFKELCESIGEPVIPSEIANTLEEAVSGLAMKEVDEYMELAVEYAEEFDFEFSDELEELLTDNGYL